MTIEHVTENDDLNEKITQWGFSTLSSLGYTLKNNIVEIVQNTPWSQVVRFATSDGYIYLKHMPEMIALEPTIIQLLHDQFHAAVPDIIVANSELNCFLMKDAGIPLRTILKKQFDAELLFKAIDQFTSLQLTVSDHVDILLKIGVPDYRLDKLPYLYKQLLLQKELLTVDGLSEKEIDELESLTPTIFNLCQKLSCYCIKQTLVQPDFHDNNTLIDDATKKLTIIDLGEIVISHPFFSLVNFMHQMKKHYALKESDAAYQDIKNVCPKNFINSESRENVLKAFNLSETLLNLYGALAYYRLMMACDKTTLTSFYGDGKLCDQLKSLKNACIAFKECD
ncbi:MAG: aminoglycoside phosphotransferase family protein [Gammaproteobacteria bacterium]|nr:aminoglycoside phosphotransferase family protein [Gammaproteobacteria bacterium]